MKRNNTDREMEQVQRHFRNNSFRVSLRKEFMDDEIVDELNHSANIGFKSYQKSHTRENSIVKYNKTQKIQFYSQHASAFLKYEKKEKEQ